MRRIIGYLILTATLMGISSGLILHHHGISGMTDSAQWPIRQATGWLSLATALISIALGQIWLETYVLVLYRSRWEDLHLPDWFWCAIGAAIGIYGAEIILGLRPLAPLWWPIIMGTITAGLGNEIGKSF